MLCFDKVNEIKNHFVDQEFSIARWKYCEYAIHEYVRLNYKTLSVGKMIEHVVEKCTKYFEMRQASFIADQDGESLPHYEDMTIEQMIDIIPKIKHSNKSAVVYKSLFD